MLSIKRIGSSTGQVEYYVGLAEDDYYLDRNEAPAVWWGSGAYHLGLNGQPQPRAFRNLLLGLSPNGKLPLVQNARDARRRGGFDFSFSPPGSFDALFSQCNPVDRATLIRIGERALLKTLKAVEELCGFSRRGRFGSIVEPAGLVGIISRHETSRAVAGHVPDPNVHWHVVICNVAVRQDGSTGTIDSQRIYEEHMKLCLGALFRAELSKELEQLSLTTHRPRRENGRQASWFEIDCVPKRLTDEFSKRRHEIERWLRKKGLWGAKAAERAALATRQAKKHFPRAKLFAAWKNTAERLGVCLDKVLHQTNHPPIRNVAQETTDAVNRAIQRLTDDQAHFSELALLRYSAEEAQTRGVGIAEVRLEVETYLEHSPDIVPLGQNEKGVRQFTTLEMLELESKLIEQAYERADESCHVVQDESLAQVLAQFTTIKSEQAQAVRHICQTPGATKIVNGWAGTGKTFMLAAANRAWQAAGFEVIGTALAAKAAQNLELGSQIKSVHIDRLFWELDQGRRQLGGRQIIVVDEAGMLGTRKLAKLVDRISELKIKTGAAPKLVLVGDYRQLQPIEAGGPLKGLMDRLGGVSLREITRQQESWARRAVVEIASGDVEPALFEFAKRGLLSISDDGDEACRKLVADWSRDGTPDAEKLIIAGTRLETRTLNRLCQQERMSRGELGSASLTVGKSDLHTGDRVIFRRNNAALFVKNGSTGTVTNLFPSRNQLQVRLDDGVCVTVDINSYEQIEPGYAQTVHASQGQTVDSVYVKLGGPMDHRELAYVEASRARRQTRLYADTLSGGEDIEAIAKQLSRSRQKRLAHDFLQPEL